MPPRFLRKLVLPLLVTAGIGLASGPAAAEAPRVLVTIKPLHSLAAGVMEGVGAPRLLLQGNSSPHDYALRPSDASALSEAQLIVWVGEGLELFLEKPLETLGSRARVVELLDEESLIRLPLRHAPEWHREEIEAAHEHEGEHDAFDPHLWLTPENARRIAALLAAELAALDPANAPRYAENADALDARLAALDAALEKQLAPVKDKPYVVFHDGYQYFEERYRLSPIGAVAINPEQPLGAAGLAELEARIARRGPQCLFAEPQFRPKLIEALAARGRIPVATLDPLGAAIDPGPGAYFEMMENLSGALVGCLSGNS